MYYRSNKGKDPFFYEYITGRGREMSLSLVKIVVQGKSVIEKSNGEWNKEGIWQ